MLSFQFQFSQVTCLKSFSWVGMNSNKPCHCSINRQNHNGDVPQIKVQSSVIQNPKGPEENEWNWSNVSSQSIMLHCWVVSDKLSWLIAQFSALPCSITERNACQINVRVSVSSDQFKETCENVASVVAQSAQLWTACVWMANNQFNEQSWNFEESIEEWSTNNAAPVFADESLIRLVAWRVSGPVPINSVSGNTEIVWITKLLHESLKNWSPQMYSSMLRKSRMPLLENFQKLALPIKYDEKQECCQKIKATRPACNKIKKGM